MKILKERGSIYCNAGAWDALNFEINKIAPGKIFILTDANTNTYCLPYFHDNIELPHNTIVIKISHGEANKTIETCQKIWQELSDLGADRNSLLINLGGGVVTDIGGFVAATFKRGINSINIPTSLLAMVDASVGGKNGVDLGALKNQIGVIRDANCVVIDTQFLKTLPKEEVISGYAEMLKHGLIHSEKYWNSVKDFNLENASEETQLIWESVLIKNQVITDDPNEKGIRKTLNYGHTLGHAIESYLLDHPEKRAVLHGEAIGIGMILASYLSAELLNFPKKVLDEISRTIFKNFEKISFNNRDIEAIIKLLAYDKKNRDGKVLFVLLKEIGEFQIDCEVPDELIYKAFEYYKNF